LGSKARRVLIDPTTPIRAQVSTVRLLRLRHPRSGVYDGWRSVAIRTARHSDTERAVLREKGLPP
jgi:hypothetical protein